MMKNNTTEHPRGWRRRAMGALGALMIAGSALALTAAPAAALTGFPADTALGIGCGGDALCDVNVGIDIFMSRQEAESIIARSPSREQLFTVLLMANDHDNCSHDTSGLTELVIADGWPQAGDGGLSAEFHKTVGKSLLDEDRGDDRDELCARIILHDYVVGRDFVYHSKVVVGHYERR